MKLSMIRIPDAIEIGGITYEVQFHSELPQGRVAQIHFTKGTIEIDDGLGDEVTFVSFIHEIVHGVMQAQDHFQNDMIYNDEAFTERTAQLMTSVFKQIYDYNMLYDEYFAPQEEEEKDVLTIDVEVEE